MDPREEIVVLLNLKADPYIYTHTLKDYRNVGDVWAWILTGDYRDKDFKWNNRTFYFRYEHDLLLFLLRWS